MIKPTIKVYKRDRGWRKLRKTIAKIKGKKMLTLGIHGSAGEHESGKSLVEIAALHEFGLGDAPQRSFVRAWVSQNRDKIKRAFVTAGKQIATGKLSSQAALNQLGALFQASMQAFIAAGVEPPNAESTIARKKSSTPLIHTGALRAAIDYELD